MSWWPFSGTKRQDAQISESLTRASEKSSRRVERAQAELTEAAEGARSAIGRRVEKAEPLREVLDKLIDRQSHGRFRSIEERHR